jgi:hypothetical protein
MSTAAAASRLLPLPASCENDLDFVSRATCGSTMVTRWSEGTENSYEVDLEFNQITYMSAFGYVGWLCGIEDPAYDLGSVEAGGAQTADCSAQCSVCSTGDASDQTGDLPACEPCTSDTESVTNTESLSDYCNFHHCPASLADAESEVAAECPNTSYNGDTVRTGCGVITVLHEKLEGSRSYFFDAQTRALIGVDDIAQVPYGNCLAYRYIGGTSPSSCVDQSECSLCATSQGAAGSGAGGVAGYNAGGMGGYNLGGNPGSALPPCAQ